MRKRSLLPLFLCVLAASAAAAPCRRDPQVLRVLFIGNSYTYVNDLPLLTRDLATAAGKRTEVNMAALGGADLVKLFQNAEVIAKIREGCWDDVVLQDQSELGGYINDPQKYNAESFYWAVRAFHNEIRAAGAKTILFVTWERRDHPVRQDLLYAAYRKMADETGARVAPVGQAWDRAFQERPKVRLHLEDQSHPSLAGSYLAACVFYAVLYGKSPAGLPPEGLPAELAAFLQNIAWSTVQAYKN